MTRRVPISLAALTLVGAVVVLAATPVGVWLAVRVGASLAADEGWQVRVQDTGGALIATVRLEGVRARNDELGVTARVDELELHLRDERLTLVRPTLRWRAVHGEAPADSSATDTLRLPVASVPRVEIRDGVVELRPDGDDDGTKIRLDGVDAGWRPPDGDGGPAQVRLAARAWTFEADSTRVEGELRTEWQISETAVQLDELYVRGRADSLHQGTVRGSGRLDLTPALDVVLTATIEGSTASLQESWLDVSARGALMPLALAVRAEGEGREATLGTLSLATAGRVDEARVHVDSLRLGLLGGTLTGHGGYGLDDDSVTVEVAVSSLALGELTEGGLSAAVDGSVTVVGTVDQPAATVMLSTPALAGLADEAIDLRLDGTWRDDVLQLTARSQRLGQLRASGPLSASTGAYDLLLRGQVDGGL